jgi:hypothetical protein
MGSDEQARIEERWRQEALQRQRRQAALDRMVEDRRAEAEEERRFWRELDPFNFGHWRGGSRGW